MSSVAAEGRLQKKNWNLQMGALTHHPTHLLVDIFCVKGANYWEIFNEHAFLFENLKYI